MGFRCGIVGLPNVGKSTLFNALTKTAAAEAANYPFCTIEPNIGRVAVNDERLDQLGQIYPSEKIIYNQIEFVDIAGLVKGASQGEGLGNKFLGHIRGVDAIIHLIRCFKDDDIAHVEKDIDPIRDIEIINTELILADLAALEKQQLNLQKKAKTNDREAKETLPLIEKILEHLNNGKQAKNLLISPELENIFKKLQLITSKPIIYVCNVGEDELIDGNNYTNLIKEIAEREKSESIMISAHIESEIACLESDKEKQEFINSLGLKESGLNKVIKASYKLLEYLTFFTVGPKEARAWNVKKGSLAPQAAGAIHTDFERGFICAETTKLQDYLLYKNEQDIKNAGKMRQEGKSYLVQDGDIFNFRFNI